MTDNFKLIKQLIQSQWENNTFDDSKDAFYMVDLIGRHKDNALIAASKNFSSTSIFKSYYIKTLTDLDKYENEIKIISDTLKLRAYISVNHKSLKQITINTMVEYANRIAQDNFSNAYSLFNSAVGKYVDHSKQLWIIDVDKEDVDEHSSLDDVVDYYIKQIESTRPNKSIVAIIPTRTGKHIITHPFDVNDFSNKIKLNKSINDFVKKNNSTLLYENI